MKKFFKFLAVLMGCAAILLGVLLYNGLIPLPLWGIDLALVAFGAALLEGGFLIN